MTENIITNCDCQRDSNDSKAWSDFKIVKAILQRGKEHGETAVLKNMIYKLSKQLSKEQASRLGSGKQLLYFR